MKFACVPVARVRRVLKRIRQLHDAHGTGREANVLLIVGLTGVGKSVVAHHYEEFYPSYEIDEGGEIITCFPVLIVEVPVNCTLKGLAGAILTTLRDVAPTKGTQVEWTRRAVGKLKKHRVEILILNEFHHLVHSDTDEVIEESAEYIKALLNTNTCQILLIGQPKGTRILRPDGQNDRRSKGVLFIEPYDWSNEQDRKEFRIVLNELEQHLGLPERSALGGYEMALRIYNACRGLPGYATRLLEQALWIAMDEELPCLSMPILARAAEELRNPNQRRWFNPFLENAPTTPVAPAKIGDEEEGKLADIAEARRRRRS